MPESRPKSLRDVLTTHTSPSLLWASHGSFSLSALAHGSTLDVPPRSLEGRSVLLLTPDQLTSALALIELDGIARRLVLCPPDLPANELPEVAARAQVDVVVCAADCARAPALPSTIARVTCEPTIRPQAVSSGAVATEWILLTSGTSGAPKLVVHTLASLTGVIATHGKPTEETVWATFYDIRRYGGLQILLRALLGGTSLVLSQAGEATADHLQRLGARGVTHLSGTPSHWRWAIVSPAITAIRPRYVRLSGEIADQPILDALRETFPDAAIGHAYASTEAGVGFDVNDGREGFPATLIGRAMPGIEMREVDGSLRIRSNRTATHYLGSEGAPLLDADGFVDTGDLIELRGDRYYFVGRRGGIINVGGLKVHPEEVEAIINRHPAVQMSLVRARKNPLTGAIVVADVVLRSAASDGDTSQTANALKLEIMQACRERLPQHKVPAAIRFVSHLDVSAAGKIARANA